MDDEPVAARQLESATAHSLDCPTCQAFLRRSARVRGAVRIRAAEPVPDLVDAIVTAAARDRTRPVRTGHRHVYRGRHRRPMLLAPAAAGIAGLIVGSVIVGGPWQRPSTRSIAAAALVQNVRDAAPTLDSFRGTYTIRELGFSAEVPERRLDMEVAFLSPQRFRLEVHDRTRYPSASWTPTDLTYIEDGSATYTSGPSGCPGDLAPGICPPTRAAVTHIAEFSAAAPLPADLILPVATFGSSRGFDVVGRERLEDRDTVRVRLSFARAAPMFPFLRIGGSWRPFFDRDRVVLWLDARSWLPVRYVVFPSRSAERRAWELRYGRALEPADLPILDVRMVSTSEEPPDPSVFAIPGASRPVESPLADVPSHVGYLPATPAAPGDLRLVSVVLPTASAESTPRSLLLYADGLDYLRVGERRGWTGPGPFGPVDVVAEEVRLPGGGVGYYEPAGEGFGRRLALHAPEGDLYLETNLSRDRLLSIASSIPILGRPLPRTWSAEAGARIRIDRVGVAGALAAAGLSTRVRVDLPGGYEIVSAERARIGASVAGFTLHLRQSDMDAAGDPLTLHVEPGTALAPPSSADQSTVIFSGVRGRWTPARSQLEWLGRVGYVSLQGDVGLTRLLSIARVIQQSTE
jgi:hypothetical protein